MELNEIIEKCRELEVYEKRCITNDYNELVFYHKHVDEWYRIFTEMLGPAIKPAGVRPKRKIRHLTKDYGGILKNQTLFKKDFDKVTIIAMFWPWQDNMHITLKMILLKKQSSG